jgi:CDGSH-type Zn-finger protein/uncharacterized Fe-S cluster protein YjdI
LSLLGEFANSVNCPVARYAETIAQGGVETERDRRIMARKSYTSEGITVSFDGVRCIHAAECVAGLPEVFDTRKRPWIQPGRSDLEAVTEVVLRCPSGALQFEREDGVREAAPDKNSIDLVADGPLYVWGDVEIKNGEGGILYEETRAALCRCGASENKPFCDNSHKEAGFSHDGSLGENRLSPEAPNGQALVIVPIQNGPLLLSGKVELRDAAGEVSYEGGKAAICRCGRSANKPFCDGGHARTGWREEGEGSI